jgi:hypothetical protein
MFVRHLSLLSVLVCAAIAAAATVSFREQGCAFPEHTYSFAFKSVRDETGAAIAARELRITWENGEDPFLPAVIRSGESADGIEVRAGVGEAVVIDLPASILRPAEPEAANRWPPIAEDLLVLHVRALGNAGRPALEGLRVVVRSHAAADAASRARDLGEIVLTSAPRIAYGVAVALDPEDERFDARIGLVEKLETWAEDATEPVVAWQRVDGLATHTDAHGAFTLNGKLVREVVEKTKDGSYVMTTRFVLAEAAGRAPVLAALEPGQNGPIVLALPKTIEARGQLVVDADIDPLIFDIELEYHRATPLALWLDLQPRKKRGVGVGFAAIDEKGVFTWTGLAPGIVDLRVRIAGSTEVLFESGFTEINAAHHELGEIDLRGRVPTGR